jgi:hypothetical protein
MTTAPSVPVVQAPTLLFGEARLHRTHPPHPRSGSARRVASSSPTGQDGGLSIGRAGGSVIEYGNRNARTTRGPRRLPLQEHRRCGDLEGGVGADIVWMSCDRPLPVTRLKRPVHWKT